MIRLFVGTDPQQGVAERALEASVRANTSVPVGITWMRQGDKGWKWGGRKAGWATPFSLFRWEIPTVCDYEGRAIYMDVDMLVLGDLLELWEWEIPEGKCAAIALPADVIVWECNRAPKGPRMTSRRDYQHHRLDNKTVPLPGAWNHRDLLKDDTKLLHFTKMRTQPWKPYPDRFPYDKPHPCRAAEECFWHYANQTVPQ